MKTQRPPKGTPYYYVVSNVMGTKLSIEKSYDFRHEAENRRYEAGNYFESEQEALTVCDSIRRLLKES